MHVRSKRTHHARGHTRIGTTIASVRSPQVRIENRDLRIRLKLYIVVIRRRQHSWSRCLQNEIVVLLRTCLLHSLDVLELAEQIKKKWMIRQSAKGIVADAHGISMPM